MGGPFMDDQMHRLLEPVRAGVVGAIQDILTLKTFHDGDWVVVERIRNTSELGATVGFASPAWQGACTLGISIDGASTLFPGGDEDYVFDALGEICNTICGVLAAHPMFVDFFGFLEQTPPVFSRGGAWLPRTPGIAGTVLVGNTPLSFGFSIRMNT